MEEEIKVMYERGENWDVHEISFLNTKTNKTISPNLVFNMLISGKLKVERRYVGDPYLPYLTNHDWDFYLVENK
jgi:hypothetical protein